MIVNIRSTLFASLMWFSALGYSHLVEGTVVNAGSQPVGGIDIDFFDAATQLEIPLSGGDTTNIDGTFAVEVGSGVYDIHFTPPAGTGLAGAVRENISINQDTSLATVQLPAGYRVFITILDINDVPLDHIVAQFSDSGGQRVFTPRNTSNLDGLIDTVVPQNGSPFEIMLDDARGRGFAAKNMINFSPSDDVDLGPTFVGPSQTLNGRAVRFDNAQPVMNVDIDIFCDNGLELDIGGDFTAGDGIFNITGLSNGRYLIVFRPPSPTGLARREFRKVEIKSPLNMGNVVLGVIRQATGRVLAPNMTPVSNADLNMTDQAYGFEVELNNDNTGVDGRFGTETTDGIYTVVVRPPDGSGYAPKTIFDVDIGANIDLGDIILGQGMVLSGTITAEGGQPILNANLDVIDPVTGKKIFTADDESAEDGRYSAIVPEGTWDLLFSPPPSRDNLGSVLLEDVLVSGNQTIDVELPLINAAHTIWSAYE